MADEAAKISVVLEAQIAKLQADMAQAQAIVANGTERMSQTVERNDPFKSFRGGLGKVVFGISAVTAGITVLDAAFESLAGNSDKALASLRSMPLAGPLLGRIIDGVEKLMEIESGGEYTSAAE